jgi:hypothetical protein
MLRALDAGSWASADQNPAAAPGSSQQIRRPGQCQVILDVVVPGKGTMLEKAPSPLDGLSLISNPTQSRKLWSSSPSSSRFMHKSKSNEWAG